MANHEDDLYEGEYYVEDEPYSPVHIQDPRTLPNNPPPVVVSNMELLGALHRMEQNQSRYNTRLNTIESILEELAPRRPHQPRSHDRRGRRRFRRPTPRMLEYEDTTPGANRPQGTTANQGAQDTQGAPLTVSIPLTQPEGPRQVIGSQNTNARSLAERLGITQESLAMIVHLAGEEQRGRQETQGAPPEQRRDTGVGRTYREVRGRGRDHTSIGGRGRGPPIIEYLPSQSESSQHTPNQQGRRRSRPPNGQTGATHQTNPQQTTPNGQTGITSQTTPHDHAGANPQANVQQTVPIITNL